MLLSDQPGRVLAVFILSPLLIACGILLLKGKYIHDIACMLIVFSVVFFFYELFWLLYRDPKLSSI